jgi:hypothetical protein
MLRRLLRAGNNPRHQNRHKIAGSRACATIASALAETSSDASLVVAADSGHHVQIDPPPLVVDAIGQPIARLRR